MISLLAIVAVLTLPSSLPSSLLGQHVNIAVGGFSTSPVRRLGRTSIATASLISTLQSSKSSSSSGNEKVNGSSGNKRSEKTAKRRFLQQVHPVRNTAVNNPSTIPPQNNQQGRRSVDVPTALPPTSSTAPNTDRQESTARIGPPLRTNKSIEELEAILEKRWGTSTTTFSSTSLQPKKNMNAMANRVLDPWAKEEKGDDNTFSAIKATSSTAFGAAKSATAKRSSSLSPSRGDDNQQFKKKGRDIVTPNYYDANETQVSPRSSQRQQQRMYNREDAILNKVRWNQERLQSRKRVSGGKGGDEVVNNDRVNSNTSSNNNYRYNDSNVPIINVSQRDYYDEDDEGYEEMEEEMVDMARKNRRRNSNDDGNDPSNAGNWQDKRNKTSSSPSSSILSGGGGIFFSNTRSSISNSQQNEQERPPQQRSSPSKNDNVRANTAANTFVEKEDDDDRKEVKRLKRNDPVSLPLRDEDGEEMFLTLEQADKIVKSILSSTQSSSSENDDESFIDADDDDNVGNSDVNDINQWEDIGITDPALLSNLRSNNKLCCPYPLAAQDRACPPIVAGNDVLLSTHTGSGKTLAFLAPIAQSLLINGSGGSGGGAYPKAIVIAPGRELASQIVSVAQTLFADTGLTVALAIGGTPYSRNVEKLRKMKPDVVVGTPGRISELIIGRPDDNGGKMKVSALQTIVLDEFDALLQYDAHVEPTMAILKAVDRQHGQSLQRVFCSATASDMLGGRNRKEGADIEAYLRPGYAHASVDENDLLVTSGIQTKTRSGGMTTSVRVSKTTIHGTLHVPSRRLALEAVRKILNTNPTPQQALIFVDSPRRVDIVIEKLAEMDIVAAPLHGGSNSGKGDRAEVNKALREGYVGIVVATEMAARGIDAPYLTHVINLDLPTDASHYAHRAGRCGRGGRPGVAVSITCDVREKGVPKRLAEELGITMYNVEAREGKLKIVQ